MQELPWAKILKDRVSNHVFLLFFIPLSRIRNVKCLSRGLHIIAISWRGTHKCQSWSRTREGRGRLFRCGARRRTDHATASARPALIPRACPLRHTPSLQFSHNATPLHKIPEGHIKNLIVLRLISVINKF